MGDIPEPDTSPDRLRYQAERRLSAEHAITRILALAPSFEVAAPQIVQAIGERLAVDACLLWTPDALAAVLRCREAWYRLTDDLLESFVDYSRRMTFASGIGLPGRVWTTHRPARIENIQTDTNFPRAPLAAQVGLQAGVGFPILAGDQCLGVIEFFTREPMAYDQPLLDMLGAVGSEIGQFVHHKQAEEALRHAHLRLELAEIAARGFGFDWDIVRNTVEHTQGITAVLGYTQHELPKTPAAWSALIHPDDREQVRTEAQTARQRNGNYSIEYRVRHKDGHYIYVWDRGMELRDERGEATRIIGSTVDITERKQAELDRQFLSDLDTQIRLLADPDAIRTFALSALGSYLNVTRATFNDVDPDSGQVIMHRPWHQATAPSLAGQYQLTDMVAPEVLDWSRAGHTLVIHNTLTDPRSAERYATGYGALGIGALISVACMREGRWSALLSVHSAQPRQWRPDEVASVESVAAHVWPAITRARAENALRESQAVLALAMRSGRMGAWARDLATNQVWWSHELEAIFGLPAGGFAGSESGFYDLVHPTDRHWIGVEVEAAINERRDYIIEFRFYHADGSLRWMEGRGRAVYATDGVPLRLYGIGIDITERKQSELERENLLRREQVARAEAEAASRAKDEFLATVSHELRTPLTAILGWASTLRTGRARVDTQHALLIIEQNARAQAQLIDDILDISRIVAGKFKLDMRPTRLATVIQAAVETIRPAAEARSIQLHLALDPSPPPIAGDADRLQQVVWNLVSNAVKFTPLGGHVWVELIAQSESQCITVRDTGIGIAHDFLPYVFERFSQADGSTSRQHQGLGLGLAIVRHIIEMHGGTVYVDSPGEGQGATFTVCLPTPSLPHPPEPHPMQIRNG